ncbi:hypothetical protein [Nocardiopsis sp. CC223A]|uniref:hypothetical protein n=1 Tax=Nocardiopsis sp. CC223A TaxID=3044051 RepID=UPI00278C4F85|nr:hypothetical protein [Nocardiopsis sp. CC223A]
MVITAPRALARARARARRALAHRALAAPLVAGVALLVVFSVPGISAGEPALPVLPSYGVASAPHVADDEPGHDRVEQAGHVDHRVTVGPPPSTCDTRSGVRDLPDALPVPVLNLASWDQPWWPADPPSTEPVPEQGVPRDLPPTRAPPLTAPPS